MKKVIRLTESDLVRLVNNVINEQRLKNIGDKIKTGTQNVVNKVTGGTPNSDSNQEKKGRDLNQLRTEWSKINQDTSNMKGYGEGVSQNISAAHTTAMMNADVAILKKMGKQEATFGSTIVDEATFQLKNGNYIKLVVLEPTRIQEN